MQYFILLPGDDEKDCIKDSNLLGESSFKKFYPGSGLRALMRIVDTRPDILTHITIKTDRNQTLSVEEFLKEIENLIIVK